MNGSFSLADRLHLLPALEARRDWERTHTVFRERTRSHPQRSDPRQSIGPNECERGERGYAGAKRLNRENVLCLLE